MSTGPSSARPEIAAFVTDEESLRALREAATERALATEHLRQGDIAAATVALAKSRSPRVLVVEIADARDAPAKLNALADVCEPETRVIVTGTDDSFRYYRTLMDLGVSDYLLKPFTAAQVTALLAKPAASAPAASAEEKKTGELIAVIGARGGIGATTIVSNLAWLASREEHRHVALLDLDPQFGATAMLFDLEPARGLRDALSKPDRVDSLFIERVMVQVDPRLSLLASEEPLEEVLTVHADAPAKILGALRAKFSHVFVDLPRTLDAFSRYVLSHADRVLIVCEPSVLSLRDGLRVLDLTREKLKNPRVSLVLNRVGMLKRHEMSEKDFAKSIGTAVEHVIPFEPTGLACANKGKLLAVAAKASPTAKALGALAERIAGQAAVASEEKPRGRFARKKG